MEKQGRKCSVDCFKLDKRECRKLRKECGELRNELKTLRKQMDQIIENKVAIRVKALEKQRILNLCYYCRNPRKFCECTNEPGGYGEYRVEDPEDPEDPE